MTSLVCLIIKKNKIKHICREYVSEMESRSIYLYNLGREKSLLYNSHGSMLFWILQFINVSLTTEM